jgi:hypothetical protein
MQGNRKLGKTHSLEQKTHFFLHVMTVKGTVSNSGFFHQMSPLGHWFTP